MTSRIYIGSPDGTETRGRWHAARVLFAMLTALFFVVAGAETASAQSASFRSVDTNRDGVLSYDELVAAFGREGANRLLRSTDHDGDGRITLSELRRGPDDRDDDRRPGSDNDHGDDRDDDRDDGDDGGGDDGSGDDGSGDDGSGDGGGEDGGSGDDDGEDDGGEDDDGGDDGGDDD